MKVIISPAKTLNFDEIDFKDSSKSVFLDMAEEIITELRKLTVEDIGKKLKVNENLAKLNYKRYQNWKKDTSVSSATVNKINSKQAIFTYNGHLFKNIELDSFRNDDIDYLQDNLVIISTLYGVLRPLDLIMPYRLDFLAKIKVNNNNLYAFWQDIITDYFNELNDKLIINLASNEYSKVLNRKKLNKKVVDIVFKEFKNGKYKTMSMSAKKMRGRFLNFLAKNKITDLEFLKKFDFDNYKFSEKESSDNCFTFLKN